MVQEDIHKPAASTTAPVPVKEEIHVPVTAEKSVTVPTPTVTEENVVSEKEAPVPEPEVEVKATKVEEITTGKTIVQMESFKEEGYLASELLEVEKKALYELKEMLRAAFDKREFTAPPPTPAPAPVKEEKVEEKKAEEIKEEKTEVVVAKEEVKTEENSAAPATLETKFEEKSAAPPLVETKTAAPLTTEAKKEEISVASIETKPAAPVVTETKKEEKSVAPTLVETKPAAPVVTETKKEEKSVLVETKPVAPVVTEAKKEEKSLAPTPVAPAVTETKKEEKVAPTPVETKPAAPVVTETKKEEKLVAPTPVETKPAVPVPTETKKEEKSVPVDTKPAAPVTTETKKEEKSVPIDTKPAAPVTTESKKEEKSVPVDTKPAAPVTTETKKEEKIVPVETKPAAPVVTETKKEEKATASAHVETKPATPVTSETKKEEAKAEVVTIEKAFAADEEDGTKTKEAIEESIVSVTLPETTASIEPEEVSIWGIPLLEDERSDVILLKFLRARDFKVIEAFTMLKNTVQWRKENNIDELVAEDLEGSEFEKIVFTHGVDKQGHVVIYSSYGEFQNKEIFSDKEKFNKFLKWRIQFQEKCVRSLDFSPEAKSSFVFVSDFKNAPGLGKRTLWQFIKRAVKQFEDNYPEFVAKELLINVPWWYIPYYKTFGGIIRSPRTRSKMVLAGPSKSADTIFKHVAPEVVPVKYGGLSKASPFTVEDGVTQAVVKSAAKYTIDLPVPEGSILSWELRVLGADVSYEAQFEPSNEGSYTVIVSKNRKLGLTDEPVITDSFKANEPGKVVITIDNQTSKKKKMLYRFKTKL